MGSFDRAEGAGGQARLPVSKPIAPISPLAQVEQTSPSASLAIDSKA